MKHFGIRNFRDMGGVRMPGGRVFRGGLFFRCGHLHDLSSEAVAYLKDTLKVRTVIDLRTPTEISEKPDVVIPGVEYLHIPVFDESVIGITKEVGTDPGKYIAKTWNRAKIRAALPDMHKIYSGALTDEGTVARLGRAINLAVDNALAGKATLFHCSQGKDRTGAMAALLLSLAGADRDVVYDDYKAGGDVFRGKAVGDFLKLLLLKFDFKAARIAYKANLARRSFIAASFETAEAVHGSLDALFIDKMGLTPDRISAFRRSLLR